MPKAPTDRIAIQLTFNCPHEVSTRNLRAYLEEAIRSWSGQFHPDDPLFYGLSQITIGQPIRNPL